MWRRLAVAGLVLFLAAVVQAQTPQALRLDVVSVKRNVSGDVASSLRPEPNGVTGVNVTPMRLIRVAYQVADFQVVDAPGWFTSERYDVTARGDGPVNMAQAGLMVRQVLAERFGLRLVQRRQEATVLELQVAPEHAPRMTRAPRPCGLVSRDAPATAPVADTPVCFTSIAGSMIARGVTTGMLAQELTRRLERFVADRTGLPDTFDFDLRWAPETGSVPEAGDTPLSTGDSARAQLADLPPLVTAVREQLGLRLVPARAPVDVWVVEAASRPQPD